MKLYLIEKSQTLKSYLKPLAESLEEKAIKSYELESLKEGFTPDILATVIIHLEDIKTFKQEFDNLANCIEAPSFYIAYTSEEDLKSFFSENSSIVSEIHETFLGFLNLNLPIEMHMPILERNFKRKQYSYEKLEGELFEANLEINEILSLVQKELGKVKKLHQKLLPKRRYEQQNFSITSKYVAGLKNGTEFFDFVEKDGLVYYYHFHSKSYVLSSKLVQLTSEDQDWKDKNDFFEIKKKRIAEELSHFQKSKKEHKDWLFYALGVIDPKSMELSIMGKGDFSLLSQKENHITFSDNQEFSLDLNLKRGEVYYINSPGFLLNGMDVENSRKLITDKLMGKSPSEAMEDLFYKLHEGRKQDFLDYDCTSSVIEVKTDALLEV